MAERNHTDFSRQLVLGEGLHHQEITVSYGTGVLIVTVLAIEQAKPRKVEIAYSGASGRVRAVLADRLTRWF